MKQQVFSTGWERCNTAGDTCAPITGATEDRITLTLGGDGQLLDAARAHEGYVAGETLATALDYDGAEGGQPASIEGRELRIGVSPA